MKDRAQGKSGLVLDSSAGVPPAAESGRWQAGRPPYGLVKGDFPGWHRVHGFAEELAVFFVLEWNKMGVVARAGKRLLNDQRDVFCKHFL